MNTPRNSFLLSGLFVFTGAMHFVIPGRFVGIMPAWIPYPLELVYLSGVAEAAGGIGLLIPRLRKAAAIGLVLLLIAVFPANIQMLVNAINDHSSTGYVALLWVRLPLQPLLIVWIYRSAIKPSARSSRRLAGRS
ncbi:MAG TPA: DoxX family protein [Gemmatimonadaceae bacterium]|nr:DoxX family protein [Gemmatimonadaceae bacterium]